MNDDENKKTPLIIKPGSKIEASGEKPKPLGILNPSFRSSCGHDHSDGSSCSGHHHDHDHHHDDKRPSEYNNSLLGRVFKGPADADEALNSARSAILLTAAAGLTQIDTYGSMPAMAGVMGVAFVVANEASEELTESIQYVKDKLNITGSSIGMILSGAHVATEGLMAVTANFSDTFQHASDYVVQVTMSNNLMHATAMTGVAGLAGALYLDKPEHRKMNIAAMLVSSGALGLQYMANDNSLLLSGVGVGTALGYAAWRIRAGIGCAQHGDLCSHVSNLPKDDTDYISIDYIRDKASQIKNITPTKALEKLGESVRGVKDKITEAKLPSREDMRNTMTAVAPTAVSFGAIVVAAHAMTDNAVSIAASSGLGTGELALITAGGLVLPELLASMKNKDLAASMILGCTVLGTGFVGGVHGALGNMSGNTLTDGWNGAVQMSGLLAPIGIYAAATRENCAKGLANFENKAADWIDRQNLPERVKGVSNWLRQSVDDINNGRIRFSRTATAAMLASVVAYSAAVVNFSEDVPIDLHHHHHNHEHHNHDHSYDDVPIFDDAPIYDDVPIFDDDEPSEQLQP